VARHGWYQPVALVRMDFALPGLARLRQRVADAAARAGLDHDRANRLVLAVNEAAANAIQHGGGSGRLEIDQEGPGALVARVIDSGAGMSQDVDVFRPAPDALRGRGFWIMYDCCDRVDVKTTPAGTTVSLYMSQPAD
jgi:anti-sigma regulatory factor (Ser/Thr protein kinase)